MRSVLGQDIFRDELEHIYFSQTERRNELKNEWKNLLAEIIKRIDQEAYENPEIEQKLIYLSERLERTKAKKVYGYLKKDLKDLIDSIVDALAEDENIASLYNLWWENKHEILKLYTLDMPPKTPLSQNKEFKSIKNDIIREAMGMHQERAKYISALSPTMLGKENNQRHTEAQPQNANQGSPDYHKHAHCVSATAVTRLMKSLANTFQDKTIADQEKKLLRADKRQLQEIEEKKNAVIQQY